MSPRKRQKINLRIQTWETTREAKIKIIINLAKMDPICPNYPPSNGKTMA